MKMGMNWQEFAELLGFDVLTIEGWELFQIWSGMPGIQPYEWAVTEKALALLLLRLQQLKIITEKVSH